MALFRITHNNFEEIFSTDNFDTMHPDEWAGESINRINELESLYDF